MNKFLVLRNIIPNKRTSLNRKFTNYSKYTFSTKKDKIKEKQEAEKKYRESTKDHGQAIETFDKEKESWQKFTDFMMKREKYTWEDYLQQVIV
jgi:hypothetical protein